ncbi:hypothetical protein C1H46_011054 [Malus baccata]|uniref:DC1 domain-containing protein n=1 Tax=Malus baccata TaxID=106549 RepID=A0A540MX28_MALBA|nr:hypothetical protein C1H46_011054 [Malus baccata]
MPISSIYINHVRRYPVRSTTLPTPNTLFFSSKTTTTHVVSVCNCNQSHRRGYILSHYCSKCNFCIDLKCAWQNDGHEHNFTILRKPIEFTCDVCGPGDGSGYKDNFYLCNICKFLVHEQCSWLPLRVKISWHQHCLKLTWWFQDMYPKDQYFCDICSTNMDGNHALYCCHDHECRDYAAHCKCLRKEGIIMNVLVDDNDDDEPSTSRCPPANETTADDKPLQIEHFSHPHMLTLIDSQEVARQDDQDEGITCNGCTLPIMRGESYRSCTEQAIEKPSNFSLHINCAKLPRKRLLPLHEHELTLLPTASSVGDVFECDMCKSLSQGFSFHCEDSDFKLDLYCNILYERKPLRCDAHVHTLQFSTELVSCSSYGTRERISASDVAVRDATSSCVFHVLNYLLRSGTITTIILSNSLMLVLKMSSMSTIVTYAKENEIQNIGSTPAWIVTLNVILIALEGGIRKSS